MANAGNLGEAVERYRELLADPAQPRPAILVNLGNALRALRRFGEAEASYREAAAAGQASAQRGAAGTALENLALLLADTGRRGQARAALEVCDCGTGVLNHLPFPQVQTW